MLEIGLTDSDHYYFFVPQVPYRDSYKLKDCDNRRKWVEKVTGKSLFNVGQWLDPQNNRDSHSTESLAGNIENLIGLAKIPLGVIGPLLIKGDHVNEHILCPFATTEGALVASSTRGATAMTRYLTVNDNIQI